MSKDININPLESFKNKYKNKFSDNMTCCLILCYNSIL